LLTATVAPDTKLKPLIVTGTVAPWTPLLGFNELITGTAAVMANVDGGLVPAEVPTVTLKFPVAALPAIVKLAVICVALTTLTLLTVTPGLLIATVAPVVKFAPVIVTGTVAPCAPLDGPMVVIEGAAAVMVNVVGAVVPPGVDTVTLLVPGVALEDTAKVAVTCVAFTTVTLDTAIFEPALITTSQFRSVPVIVTGTFAPGAPALGEIEVIVGAVGVPARISMAQIRGLYDIATN
jgi:hypothetical protein